MGGFRSLSYTYDGGHCSIGFKSMAEKYEKIFNDYGIEIKIVKEK